jgi:hypothetical protein
MACTKKPVRKDTRLNAARRKSFLEALSETANVASSARAAGIASSSVYAERRRSPAFRAAWQDALGEGYARLEADLLADALQNADGQTSDATLKARAQKHRLGISLLNVHRTNAKGTAEPVPRRANTDLGVLKAQLILKLTQMRERAGISLAGSPDDEIMASASEVHYASQ